MDTAPAWPGDVPDEARRGKSIMPSCGEPVVELPGLLRGERQVGGRPVGDRAVRVQAEADAEIRGDLSPGAGGLGRCEDLLPSRWDTVRRAVKQQEVNGLRPALLGVVAAVCGESRDQPARASWARTGSEARS